MSTQTAKSDWKDWRDMANDMRALVNASYGALTPDGCDLPPSGIYSMPDKIRALHTNLTTLRTTLKQIVENEEKKSSSDGWLIATANAALKETK